MEVVRRPQKTGDVDSLTGAKTMHDSQHLPPVQFITCQSANELIKSFWLLQGWGHNWLFLCRVVSI